MNKKMNLKLRALLVTNMFMTCSILFSQQNHTVEDDRKIVDYILNQKENKYYLEKPNSNIYLISKLKYFKTLELENKLKKLDSVKQISGFSKNDTVLERIFNLKNYAFLIEQKNVNTEWKTKTQNNSKKQFKTIFISKPLYTKDNRFALVYIKHSNIGYTQILKKNSKNSWVYYKLIFPELF